MQASAPNASWTTANQAYLVGEFARLKELLRREPAAGAADTVNPNQPPIESPAAIDCLAQIFDLSMFERDLLLLCAGVEMDSQLAAQCGEILGRVQQSFATFGLALAALPDPHWSALTPSRPLRRFRLVELAAGAGLTSAPLRIDERILHYLAGINSLDSRLQFLVRASPFPDWIADNHRAIAEHAARSIDRREDYSPVLHLGGDDTPGQEDVACLIAHELGLWLFTLSVDDLQATGPELDQLAALWERESLLLPGALLIQCGASGLTPSARQLVERLAGLVFVASRDPIRLNRPLLRFEVSRPQPAEQKRLWENVLGTAAQGFNGALDRMSEHFRLSARTISSTGSLTRSESGNLNADELWNACRSISRPRLDDLAQRIVPIAEWDDLVLPDLQKQTLRQLSAQVRRRMHVHETWGFSSQGNRGLGLSALFAGESGTGKTLAAEVLAKELGLDLYRIDLSAVVSKYVGDTEKNMKRVFDAAEEGGALLLFDEADALFGKRGEVKDSHDRYANIEVGFLLQSMEAFRGLAILTTNLKSSLDRAFQRRLRFIVTFPFPDAAQREAIWGRVFPAKTPTRGLAPKKLAQLNVSGGNIRNIALNAAFFAADSNAPVGMEHILQAAKLETQKLERPLSDAEIRGWA